MPEVLLSSFPLLNPYFTVSANLICFSGSVAMKLSTDLSFEETVRSCEVSCCGSFFFFILSLLLEN